MHSVITDSQLLHLNRHGLIPGPNETVSEFLKRTEMCLNLTHQIAQEASEVVPFQPSELAPAEVLAKPLAKSAALYDIAPDWIPVFFSNQGLLPWHGGCAWICQLEEDQSPLAFFQLRKNFARQSRYLGLYQRDELVVHEMSHVGRMTFQEPLFEEILAYRTATSRFRRWFGPILHSSRETLLFVLLLFFVLLADLAVLLQPSLALFQIALGLKALTLALIGYAVVRLAYRQRRFKRCLGHLQALFSQSALAERVIYRLTDREIMQFSELAPREILHYAHSQANRSLRWRLLLLAYFAKSDWRPTREGQ